MTEEKKEKNNYSKSILKAILTMSIPIVFVNILQVLYSLTDTFWVGKMGANAVAAVSIGFPILFLVMAIASGLTTAGSIFVSQYKGKNDEQNINKFSIQTLLIVSLVSIILSIVGYFISEPLFRLMGAPSEIIKDATIYLQISFMTLLPMFIFYIFQSLMRGVGEVKKATYIISLTVLLNFFIDPLFIFGGFGIPAMGVAGSAIATGIAQIVSAIIAIYFLFFDKKNEIKLKADKLKIEFKYVKEIFKLGMPSSVEQMIRSSGFFVSMVLVTSFGTIIVSSFSLGIKIFSFAIIPAIGFMVAISVLIGQAIGAKDLKRVDEISKQGSILSFASLAIVGFFLFIFAKQIAQIFIPGDFMVIEKSAEFIRYLSFILGFFGLNFTLNGMLIGSGNTKISMFLTILETFTGFVIALILSKFTPLGYIGIWISYMINVLLMLVITYVIILRGNWKHKEITKEIEEEEIMQENIIKEIA